ncbi:hypothetical protein CPS_4799 [Colwellia psychrerythraea 34H]|uniref:Uncharacterized protein n=1 Tax=Colwellia psychrerythraea (strain 34H / ATCC BAA-681) TaxID=167879 RepID=Q47UT4_COLP3|nr:hypothetical protein CPS_4799 [Colwellia psychrerythraea 34H]
MHQQGGVYQLNLFAFSTLTNSRTRKKHGAYDYR